MATVIDSLVLEFGIDPRNFTKGQREAVEQLRKFQGDSLKVGKDLEAQQRRSSESLAGLKREALGFLGVAFGGAAARRFLDYVTDLDASIGRTSKTLSISTRDLSAWQGAVEQSGGSAQSITGALQGLSGAMQQLVLTGNASFVPLFNQLGISLYKANGQLKTSSEMMLDLSKAVEGMDPARAHALLSMVPGMNEDTINLLIRGRAAVEAYLAAARSAGVTTEADAAAAQHFNEQIVLLERTATQTGRALLQNLLPGLTKFIELYGKVIQLWNGAPDWVKRLSAPINPLGGAIDAIGALSGGGAAAPAAATPAGGGAGGAAPGLTIKPGAGATSPFTSSVMGALGGMPGIDRVTSLNDPFHQARGGQHPLGQALDLTVKDPRQADAVMAQIRTTLAGSGIDASVSFHPKGYLGATADHIHIGARGAALTAPGGAGGAAAAGVVNNSSSRGGDTNTSSTQIGSIVIHDASGSAQRIGGQIGAEVKRQNLAAPFNSGQQ